MDFLLENWGSIAGIITGLIAIAGMVAEMTKNETDNKVVKVIREIWAKIPIFGRDATTMGRKPK